MVFDFIACSGAYFIHGPLLFSGESMFSESDLYPLTTIQRIVQLYLRLLCNDERMFNYKWPATRRSVTTDGNETECLQDFEIVMQNILKMAFRTP